MKVVQMAPAVEKLDPLVAASDELLGEAIILRFEHFGWCIGELKKKNTGKRRKIDGKMVKFERGGDHRGLPVPGGRRVTYIPRRGLSVLAPAGA